MAWGLATSGIKDSSMWLRAGLPHPCVYMLWTCSAKSNSSTSGERKIVKLTCTSLIVEKEMAAHSSVLAWRIPWTEEPGRLQSMGSLRVGHDWATSLSLFTFMYWRRKWQPTPVFLPGEPRNGGAWWAAIYGVAQSRTRLKWLSSLIVFCVLYSVYLEEGIETHSSILTRIIPWTEEPGRLQCTGS